MRPVDADDLKTNLENLYDRCGHCDGYGYYSTAKVLQTVNEAPTIEQPTWISVEDRLPNTHEDVLVYDATAAAVTCGCLSFLGEWFGVPMENKVTHWMPLPQPPKGE